MNKTVNFGALQSKFHIKIEQRSYNCSSFRLETRYQHSLRMPLHFVLDRIVFHVVSNIVSSNLSVFENWRKIGKF